MADSPRTRQLDHRAHKFKNTVLLMLLEAGIQAEAASSLGEAIRKPGIMVWREFVCIMIYANMPGRSDFERTRNTMGQLTVCAMALRRTFDRLWGVDAAIELLKLQRVGDDHPILTILLPSEEQQRTLDKYRLRH